MVRLGEADGAGYCCGHGNSVSNACGRGGAACRRTRPRDRRRRGAIGRGRRPRRRHHRRLARQFLHRRADRAKTGADGGALRAAGRGIQDRRLWRGPAAAVAGRQDRRHASRLQHAGDAGASRHRRCRAVAAGNTRQGQDRPRRSACPPFRSWSAAASPLPASASPCAATARAAAPSASPAWSRPANRGRCRFGWSIRSGRAPATGSAPAPAIPARPLFEDKPGGPVIIGVVSWSTGPNGAAGCGGLTGVTPLTLYRDWILQTARQWGSAL